MLQSERTGGDWELYLMDVESQVQSRLTNHAGWDGYAVWSPEGKRIIFDREDAPDAGKRPWIMDLEKRISKPLGSFEGWLSISDWSKDGQLLGFHELAGQRDLVQVDLDGNIVKKITNTDSSNEHDAHFSPDESSIAYANGTLDGSQTSLEILNIETGEISVIKTSIGRIYGISWSPDGEKIAFVDAPGGDDDDADIFIYVPEDASIRQVTDDPAWDHMPEFCGSSQSLFFTSYRSGEERIYRIDPDPQPLLKITRGAE